MRDWWVFLDRISALPVSVLDIQKRTIFKYGVLPELEILPLGSSGKILTPLGFLTKACGFKTSNLADKQANLVKI